MLSAENAWEDIGEAVAANLSSERGDVNYLLITLVAVPVESSVKRASQCLVRECATGRELGSVSQRQRSESVKPSEPSAGSGGGLKIKSHRASEARSGECTLIATVVLIFGRPAFTATVAKSLPTSFTLLTLNSLSLSLFRVSSCIHRPHNCTQSHP
jgi:hypothetical protein